MNYLVFKFVPLFLERVLRSSNLNYCFLENYWRCCCPSISKKCEIWFRRFQAGNFDVIDLEGSGANSKVKFVYLQALIDPNSSRTQQKPAETIRVCQQINSKRLREIGKIQKERK